MALHLNILNPLYQKVLCLRLVEIHPSKIEDGQKDRRRTTGDQKKLN